MKKLLILVMALVGCGVTTDDRLAGDVAAAPPGNVPEIAAPAHAAEAIAIIQGIYSVDLPVTVHWTDRLMPCGAALCGGLSFGCGDIWVADLDAAKRGTPAVYGIPMALAHELGHCARGALTGDSDGGHVDEAWWDDVGLVEQAHAAVRAAGY